MRVGPVVALVALKEEGKIVTGTLAFSPMQGPCHVRMQHEVLARCWCHALGPLDLQNRALNKPLFFINYPDCSVQL
jgi:hypothetical protein